jgi:hypothetical protein
VSLLGISRTIHGISFELTNSNAESASNAAPPHSPPPSTPGNTIVPSKDGGVNIPVLSVLNSFSTAACASGVRRVSISSVRLWRVKGGGLSGYGCVSESRSPSIGDGGTFFEPTGKSGAPVLRSST